MRQLKITRNIRLGIKNLLLHKLRSMLTMLGVVFGVGSVVAMLAVGEGASKEALARIRKLGSHNIIIDSTKPLDEEARGGQQSMMSVYGLLYEDLARLQETYPQIQRAVPVKVIRKEGRLGTQTLELRLVATSPEWFDLVRRPLIAGRVLLPRDMEEHANAVVLTEYGARRLLAARSTVGESIRIGSGYYQVVGIIQSESSPSGDFQTPDQQVDAYIPINVGREHFGDTVTQMSSGSMTRERVELHKIIAEVRSEADVEPTANAIAAMLQRFHKKQDYRLSVPLALLREAEATKRNFNIVLGSIAGISLLVGGIGIMNIMLASVTERTREIGIRRAIGAKRRQIVGQFLIETVVLSTVGGLVGVLVGMGAPKLVTYFSQMPTEVTPWSMALSLGISMGVGIVFGIYPAIRAANLDPIVALRHE